MITNTHGVSSRKTLTDKYIFSIFYLFFYKNYKSTRLQRNLQAYYYKATNYFTRSHMLANYRQ